MRTLREVSWRIRAVRTPPNKFEGATLSSIKLDGATLGSVKFEGAILDFVNMDTYASP